MTTTRDERTLIEDVLAHGVDDWLYAGWIYQIARRAGLEDSAATRAVALGLVAEVLISRLAVAGEVTEDGFQAWEMPAETALGRIVEEWLAYGTEPPSPGSICWLALTSEGEARGLAVLRREGAVP